MFNLLRKSLATGVVTAEYPLGPADQVPQARGRPEIDFAAWHDARPAAAICPTGAIHYADAGGTRHATLDLTRCIFCGLCAEADPAIRMTTAQELADRRPEALRQTAVYRLKPDGAHDALLSPPAAGGTQPGGTPGAVAAVGDQLKARVESMFGRSLHIREVDAGSCNGCEIEIGGLAGPVSDLERFGLHLVASPRHADMLLVTGPVTRNMELALRKTYAAMPAPRLVVAVGACGCSGGIFGKNYASLGGVDQVLPVDVYVPGCPPPPQALLHGILLAIDRLPR